MWQKVENMTLKSQNSDLKCHNYDKKLKLKSHKYDSKKLKLWPTKSLLWHEKLELWESLNYDTNHNNDFCSYVAEMRLHTVSVNAARHFAILCF